MRTCFNILLILMLVARGAVAADRVQADHGGIVLESSSGQKTELTQTGLDSDPWISPDGRSVVFVRRLAGDAPRASVYEIDLPSREPKLVYAGPARYQGRESSWFGRPELDESRDVLYLLSNESATSGALLSVRLATGETRLISDGVVGYDVIVCPKKYRGDLIALKRYEEDLLGRPYFLYSLYSVSGEDLGLAGAGELDGYLDAIRFDDCEEPQPPPTPPLAAGISGGPLRVDESVMDRRVVARVEPVYPSEARLERVEGDVRLLVRVGADGAVQEVNLVSGPPQLFEAAKAAVRQWRFRPVAPSGRPVAVVTTVNIRFRLPSANR